MDPITQNTSRALHYDSSSARMTEGIVPKTHGKDGRGSQRTVRASELKPMAVNYRLSKQDRAASVELPASEAHAWNQTPAIREDMSSNASTSRSRVDSGHEAESAHHRRDSNDDELYSNNAAPPARSQPDTSPMPPWTNGSTPAYVAYTSLQRVLDPSKSETPDKPLAAILKKDTFLEALENPPVRHRLQKFTDVVLGPQYMCFLDQTRHHRKKIEETALNMIEIDEQYLHPAARAYVDLPGPSAADLRADVGLVLNETLPSISSMFEGVEQAVQDAIFTQAYPDFVRRQVALSASKALIEDRYRFQGLGDCFCLTQPSKADNPIMFASDGFIGVTGYKRSEIIPRNCRFLQGQDTDTAAVQRIRYCIKTQRESVEFLLNYRKNGEPFWNLLYTAPLVDTFGRTAFHIGGQVNCSSSIHSKPDIMKILAQSPDEDSGSQQQQRPQSQRGKQNEDNPASELARRMERLKLLRRRQEARVADEPGIERELLEANQEKPLPERLERFYNAYSKYLVVSYPSMTIEFFSPGISDVLLDHTDDHATKSTNVYKFLELNMIKRERSDWTKRVKNALKLGKPISVGLNLQTKRSVEFRGDEHFLTHWTPLKDVEGRTGWVVICLGLVSQKR